jgi:hypothetical protein
MKCKEGKGKKVKEGNWRKKDKKGSRGKVCRVVRKKVDYDKIVKCDSFNGLTLFR